MKFSSVLESYEDRVARVAAGISGYARSSSKKVTPDAVKQVAHAHSAHELEGRLGGQAHAHLMKDAMKMARPDIASVNRSLGARARGQALKGFHNDLAVEIHTAIGNAVPDGDPFDHLLGKAERLADKHGVHDYDEYDLSDHLDKAARLNGYKGYHDQVVSAWDDYDHDSNGHEHLGTYHKDDPELAAAVDHHARFAEPEQEIKTVPSSKADHVDVVKKDKFENPWR